MNIKIKKTFFTLLIFVFSVELIIQISLLINLNWFKTPILFYNPYCHQKYWDLSENKPISGSNIVKHSILSFKKKNLDIPEKIKNENIQINEGYDLAFYGSSYINHKLFNKILNENNLSFKNYALDSYGLDQIYLSYKLTSYQNKNKTVILGFLLEDLDRSLFNKRDYKKVKFQKKNGKFKIETLPEDSIKDSYMYDFYLFRFIKNFINLSKYNFDPRHNLCEIKFKKEIFEFFINDIMKDAKKLNQKIIIVTFNLKEDFTRETSWRYSFISKNLKEKNIFHVDSIIVLNEELNSNLIQIDDLSGDDLHNSKMGFELIFNEIKRKL